MADISPCRFLPLAARNHSADARGGDHVTEASLPNSGRWVTEENLQATIQLVAGFSRKQPYPWRQPMTRTQFDEHANSFVWRTSSWTAG
jgi:hypothetical protein